MGRLHRVDALEPEAVVEWADVFADPSFRERTRSDDISWTRSDAGRAAWTTLRHGLPRARDVG